MDKWLFKFFTLNRILFFGLLLVIEMTLPAISLAKLVPASLLKLSDESSEYAIIVDKSAQKVFLYHKNDIAKPLKEFRCSTGENSGPKSRKNDRKTPNGIYFFTKSYKKTDLAPIYGDMAFPIDYPNDLDRKIGNGGYGIWFHGTNEPLKPRDTNGCIVLENESITELAGYIRLHKTPVIITTKLEWMQQEDAKHESQKLESVIKDWCMAWKNKDIPRYMDSYSRKFTARGMDWDRWKVYKERLARKYGKIEVEINNLQFFKAQGIVLAKFHQTYRTPLFESRGEKRLYLAKNSEKWKIIGEFFEKENIRKKTFAESPKPALPGIIKQFLDRWKNAWERKDLNTYIEFYDRKFRSKGMDLRAWKRYKARLNKKYDALKVRISRLKIIQHSDYLLQIRFKQEFHADSYQDSGMKDLYLVQRGKKWKIKKEIWKPLTTKDSL